MMRIHIVSQIEMQMVDGIYIKILKDMNATYVNIVNHVIQYMVVNHGIITSQSSSGDYISDPEPHVMSQWFRCATKSYVFIEWTYLCCSGDYNDYFELYFKKNGQGLSVNILCVVHHYVVTGAIMYMKIINVIVFK